jgi:hypothetical protein
MLLEYLLVQKALLYSLILFFANRSWNYYDKICDAPFAPGISQRYWIALLLTAVLLSFLIGFAVCMEIKI